MNLRSKPKPSTNDPVLSARWHAETLHRGARCLKCGGKRRLQAHHAVPQQAVKSFAKTLRLSVEETQRILWDGRNGVPVCERCHERHTLAVERIPRVRLPLAAFAFARTLDGMTPGRESMMVRLEREYP